MNEGLRMIVIVSPDVLFDVVFVMVCSYLIE